MQTLFRWSSAGPPASKRLGLLVAGCLVWSHPVAAQTDAPDASEAEPALPVNTQACAPGALTDTFLEALAVELAADGADASLPATLQRCDIAAGLVDVARDGKTAHIDVSDVPELARPRTAAVAVAETLRWWTDQPANEPPEPRTEVAAALGSSPAAPPVPAPSAPEQPARFGMDLGLRGMALGPRRSLFWGISVDGAYRPLGWLRASVGVSYLTTAADPALGAIRVHALGGSGALDLIAGRARPQPAVEARLGIGAEWLGAMVVAKSAFGYDEPPTRAWALLADAHAALATPIHRAWSLSFAVAAVKDLRGVAFQAGGEESISLYGWGVASEARIERAF